MPTINFVDRQPRPPYLNQPQPVATIPRPVATVPLPASGTQTYASPEQVAGAYQQYLGRGLSRPDEATLWTQRPDWETGIRESPEAKAYRARRAQVSEPLPSFDPRMQDPVYAEQQLDLWRQRNPQPAAAATPAPGGLTFGGGDPLQWVQSQFGSLPPTPQSLGQIHDALKAAGVQVERPTHAGGLPSDDKLTINGRMYDLIVGWDGPNPQWALQDVSGNGGGAPSSYMAQFNDPSTRLLEQYLTQQMSALSGQQTAQEQANAGLRSRMPDIQAATDRLVKYLNERATQLQGAPYTGTEQEILRTQVLDPIERDRTAANQRALQQIGGRGLTPESGISQELMNQVNSVFDRARAGAQGDIAYRTVQEQRDRQREAQQLLGLVPQVQRAGATGDLALLQALDAAVNQPAGRAIGLATANQRLPSMAMDDALRVMGMGGSSPDAVFQQAMELYGMQNQQNQQGLGYWQMLGSALPYLLGQGAR